LDSRKLVLTLAVLVLLLSGLYFYHYLPDDTFITLRYARNVLAGRGIVFNEGERLEGYTNFLWLLIVVLVGRLGTPLITAARTLSLICSAGTLVLASRSMAALMQDEKRGWNTALAVALPALVLASAAPVLTWSFAGTEIPLFTFLLLLGFTTLRNGKRPAAVFAVFGLLGLVRPEGLIFYALAGVVLLARCRSKREVVAWGALVLAVLYAPYLVWKYRYFGSLLPNTFFAKTGPPGLMARNGARYLGGFLVGYGYILAIGLLLGRGRLRDFERVILPVCFILVHWAAVLMLGGDWMPNYRLLVPTLPLILLVPAAGLRDAPAPGTGGAERTDSIDRERPRRNPTALVTVALVVLVMIPGGLDYDHLTFERTTVRAFAHLGQRLHEIFPPGTRIACGSTGAIGYYTDMPIIDILGLTEAHIARYGRIVAKQPGHLRTDGAYVLERDPDLILLGNIQIHRGRRSEEQMPIKVQERDIVAQPRFSRDYEFVNIPLGEGFYLSCYKRRNFFLPLTGTEPRR
jgi:hypothetical protein